MPARGLRDGSLFTVVVHYAGVPETVPDGPGFIATDDGAFVAGQPGGASTWFPANDHPIDKAAFRFDVTVPDGLDVTANGVLTGQAERDGRTTWTWKANEPMATYLATVAIGGYDSTSYEADGIWFWDSIDTDLSDPVIATSRTGDQFAFSGVADMTYKRLARTIAVPADGAELSFWVDRATEEDWDHVFVEAHTPGQDDWTTLPDLNGHTDQDTGESCPFWLAIHPFLAHYQSVDGGDACAPTGSTGDWWAATGDSHGYEEWTVDLAAWTGGTVEVSISYVSDDVVQGPGVAVDDIDVSTGEGTTSFEDDGDAADGWTAPGAPAGSIANENDWTVGGPILAEPGTTLGDIAAGSLARQPEIIGFLAGVFGPYPFSAAGGIVVDAAGLGFALETQTRPIYSPVFFTDPLSGDNVVVHELAHQWYGDSLAVAEWRDIWLNEGFATYAEWLWNEREGLGTPDETFDILMGAINADSPFWDLTIGDPGPDLLFDGRVYTRGAMTLHALRRAVGDDAFFRVLRRWADLQRGGNVTTGELVALAERISGQQLDELFEAWLYTPEKPNAGTAARAAAAPAATTAATLALKALTVES